MSSGPTDNPSDKPGRFDSPVPDSWAQPVPDSWASDSWSPQPDGAGAPPPPPPWPSHEGHQAPPPGGPTPADQQSQPDDNQSQPAGQFTQAGAGQSPSGQTQYPPYGQYPPDGQYRTNGQYPAGSQYPPGPYGAQWQYFTPPTARSNRVALAALICGIGQFVLGLTVFGNILLAIPAIICGSIALKQIRLRGERGHGMAVAGLVLGILGVVYFVVIVALIAVSVSVSRHSS
jgi:Domain of unknown function (DUF4190)